jgi:hypothetical protein
MTSEFVRFPRAAALACALLASAASWNGASAAGGAFAVDNAGVDDAGSCKVESWASFARNDDRIFAVAPACAVSLGQPVEFGVQVARAHSGGEWGTGLTLKAKTSIIPFPDEAAFGVAIAGGVGYDLTAGRSAEYFVALPISIRLAAPFILNLDVGAVWDRASGENFFTWGAGVQISLSEKFMLIGEVFGQERERPGMQAGLRFTPHDKIDFDLIYGRNLTGERSDWLTLGMNVRF